MQYFSDASHGNFGQRMPTSATDEIGQLAVYYNSFMTQLEEYSSNLKQEIAVRREAEYNLRESEERYRSVMEAADDPIVIYDIGGHVSYFNPAFSRVFGWSLEEMLGQKMDHFVPEENWPETNMMIGAVLAGEVLPATETRRYTKDGNIINVSISGAAYRGHNGELAGSIIILRDITETKKLTRLLMDIGDKVRQTMGQNLHDDLCPHLIGIAGLTTVLKDKVEKDNAENGILAERIIALINEATNKARGLARGLCPVHLVSHGLQAALGEICTNCTMTSGISCVFNGDERLTIKDNALATHLYYIAQEAVNNAVKHSSATTIEISLQQEDEYIHLRVIDNGAGMIDSKSDTMGIGLQIMRYRVLVIGAFLDIITVKDGGTTIHVYMKLPD
jgi:PAS domain S-box-containing protein